jgi:hypothetical protein
MAETESSVKDGSLSWDSMPFQVRIGQSFTNINQVLAYKAAMFDNSSPYGSLKNFESKAEQFASADSIQDVVNIFKDDTTGNPDNSTYDKVKEDLKEMYGLDEEGDVYDIPVMRPYFRDTRVGANDAINCIWQFNRDDDIMHPVNTIYKEDDGCIGLGRVYSNTTEQNQQICWITFGIPYYTKMAAFYKNAFDNDLIKLNQNGYIEDNITTNTSTTKLAGIFGSAIGLAFAIPALPIKWTIQAIAATHNNYPVNRFYELRGMMPLYYKYVDSILAQWLVSTGMYDNGPEKGQSWTADPDYIPDALKATGASIHDITKRKALNAYIGQVSRSDIEEVDDDNDSRNAFLRKTPPGVTTTTGGDQALNIASSYNSSIKDAAAKLSGAAGTTSSSSDDDAYTDVYAGWTDTFTSNMLGATQFLGFRIEKSVDASESFSNSTSPSSFAETFNSTVRDTAAKSADYGLKGGTGIDAVDTLVKAGGNMIEAAMKTLNDFGMFDLTGLSSAVSTGAFLDVPEQYSGSDFNKSHSISFQLRSPYGDMVSIYQSIIVPLACILAGALPRQAGSNSYNQPFLCRAYCKGMFSIPMGIIDSVSIKRGSSEFGWTYNNLPTCVDVTISIKDMSPVMYMGLLEPGWTDLWGADSSFKEYLLTLSGAGLFERISIMARMRRNFQFKAHKLRNYYFNPSFWSHEVSQWAPARVVAAIIPKTTISHR